MLTYRIEQDDDSEDPREWDHLGTMACWHSRYNLGDLQPSESPDEYMEEVIEPERGVCLPLFLYDHSGLAMSTGRQYPFDCPWDAGQVGWIHASREAILRDYSAKRLTRGLRERVAAQMRAEVAEYHQYLSGDVYGYVIEDEEGDVVDSCWGFYGYDCCEQEAKSALASRQQHVEEAS